MLKAERQDELSRLLGEKGAITIKETSMLLGISEMTIRRDFDELASQGRLVRVRGGAMALDDEGGAAIRELAELEKRGLRAEAKGYVAARAVGLVEEGDVVFIGAGTTLEELARLLPDRPVCVTTNSLPVANILEAKGAVEVYLTGGRHNRHTSELTGPIAESAVASLGFTKAFVGCNAIRGGRVFNHTMDAGIVLRRALDNADERYVLADATKFRQRDLYGFYDLADLTAIVSDGDVSEADREMVAPLCELLT